MPISASNGISSAGKSLPLGRKHTPVQDELFAIFQCNQTEGGPWRQLLPTSCNRNAAQ